VQVIVEDPDSFRPFATYLGLLRHARQQETGAFAWRRETYEFETDRPAIDLLLGRADLRPMIEAGLPLSDLERCWEAEVREFLELRRRFLLYD
jgi:uncharacterized protein YbbC (DUF1343 family)